MSNEKPINTSILSPLAKDGLPLGTPVVIANGGTTMTPLPTSGSTSVIYHDNFLNTDFTLTTFIETVSGVEVFRLDDESQAKFEKWVIPKKGYVPSSKSEVLSLFSEMIHEDFKDQIIPHQNDYPSFPHNFHLSEAEFNKLRKIMKNNSQFINMGWKPKMDQPIPSTKQTESDKNDPLRVVLEAIESVDNKDPIFNCDFTTSVLMKLAEKFHLHGTKILYQRTKNLYQSGSVDAFVEWEEDGIILDVPSQQSETNTTIPEPEVVSEATNTEVDRMRGIGLASPVQAFGQRYVWNKPE